VVKHPGTSAVAVRLNPNGIVAPLDRILRESFNNVALGLRAVEQYKTDVLPNLPTSFFHFKIGDQEEKLTEQLQALKESHRTWMLTTAFAEFIKAVFAALHETYLYCEAATAWPERFESFDAMSAYVGSVRAKAHKFDLTTLMDRVSASLNAPLALREHVLSMNKVRNCLEHGARRCHEAGHQR
jgi:hypothetical protein